jgi:hypothetical protein
MIGETDGKLNAIIHAGYQQAIDVGDSQFHYIAPEVSVPIDKQRLDPQNMPGLPLQQPSETVWVNSARGRRYGAGRTSGS